VGHDRWPSRADEFTPRLRGAEGLGGRPTVFTPERQCLLAQAANRRNNARFGIEWIHRLLLNAIGTITCAHSVHDLSTDCRQ